MHKKLLSLLALTFAAATSLSAATWYVDSTATGARNGTSWANAWTSLSAVTGVSAGDTVYISGGPSGSSQSYSTGTWSPAGGASGNPITYKIGQDSAHNGTAIFNTSGTFFNPSKNLAIVGDAGDGKMHFAATGVNLITWSTSGSLSNVRLAYINFGSITANGNNPEDVIFATSVSGFEFDHNYVNMVSTTVNSFAYMVTVDPTWDGTRIHNNEIHVPGNYSIGPDIFELGGSSGYSIYSNYLAQTFQSGSYGGQHQDGWQDTGGSSYIKIYNNYCVNLGNSCFFADGYYAGFNHLWIYNNVGVMTMPVINGWYPEGITVRPDGSSSTKTFNDVQIMNNLFSDMGAEPAVSVAANFYGSGYSASFTGCGVYNNISINSWGIDVDAGINASGNVSLKLSSNNGDFVRYVPNTPGNDFHLTAAAGALILKGANESAYFNTDIDGNGRPGSGAWDIGPYQYGGVASPYLSVSPVTDNAVDVVPSQPGIHVYEGTTVQFSDTVTYTGTNAVNWQWSYSVNGGSQVNYASGTGTTIPSASYTFPAGSAGNTYTWQLSATAGASSGSASASIVVVSQTTSTNSNYQPPVVSAITQNATDVAPNLPGIHVYEGTIVTYSATASSPVGKPLTWQWTYSLNGGSPVIFQSGSGTVLPISFTYGTGTAGTYAWSLQVSDGQTNVASPQLSTVVLQPPTAGQGLAFSATNGTITAPFTAGNGYISQAVQTTAVASAGKATYNFTITNAGSYVVQVLVNAPNDAANSLYVNMDALPTDPTMIWDIPTTTGFQLRLAGWRGLGTDTSDQFTPEVFNLGTGSHQLVICGREANVQLQSIAILKVPAAPQGLSVVAGP